MRAGVLPIALLVVALAVAVPGTTAADPSPAEVACTKGFGCAWVNGACDAACLTAAMRMDGYGGEFAGYLTPTPPTSAGAPTPHAHFRQVHGHAAAASGSVSGRRQRTYRTKANAKRMRTAGQRVLDAAVDSARASVSVAEPNVGWAVVAAAKDGKDAKGAAGDSAITYSWEMELPWYMPAVEPANPPKINTQNRDRFLLMYRPKCISAAYWLALSPADRVEAWKLMHYARGSTWPNVEKALAAKPFKAKPLPAADAKECAALFVVLSKRIDPDTEKVDAPFTFEDWSINAAPGAKPAAAGAPAPKHTLIADAKSVAEQAHVKEEEVADFVDVWMSSPEHAHQEVVPACVELCTNTYITDRKVFDKHMKVITNTFESPAVHAHVAFPLPKLADANAVTVRNHILALNTYLNDARGLLYGSVPGNTFLKSKYTGPMTDEAHDYIASHLATADAPDDKNFELPTADGARVSKAKFLNVGFRSGPYGYGNSPYRVGFELRGLPRDLAGRLGFVDDIVSALQAIDGKADPVFHVPFRINGKNDVKVSRRASDLLASHAWNPDAKAAPAKLYDAEKRKDGRVRGVNPSGLFQFVARAKSHGLNDEATAVHGGLSAFSKLVLQVVGALNGNAALQANDKCKEWFIWTDHARSQRKCGDVRNMLMSRIAFCYSTGLMYAPIINAAGQTLKPIDAKLKATTAALAAKLAAGMAAVVKMPPPPHANAEPAKEELAALVKWADDVLTAIQKEVVEYACQTAFGFQIQPTNYA